MRTVSSPSRHHSFGSEPYRSNPAWREIRLLTAWSSPSRSASKKRWTTLRISSDGSMVAASLARGALPAQRVCLAAILVHLHARGVSRVHPSDMTEPIVITDAALEGLEAANAFEAFYEAEARTLFRRMWLVTGNRAEAEELMQDAFLSVWQRWDRVGEMDDPVGYLYRTAMNLFRKRYRRAVLTLRKTTSVDLRRDEFKTAEDRSVVAQALVGLAPRQRAALVLTELMGFSSAEA